VPKLGYSIAVLIWTCAIFLCALVGGSLTGLKMAQLVWDLANPAISLRRSSRRRVFPKRTSARQRPVQTPVPMSCDPDARSSYTLRRVDVRLALGVVATGCLSLLWFATWALRTASPHEDKHVTAENSLISEKRSAAPTKRVPLAQYCLLQGNLALRSGQFLTIRSVLLHLWLPSYSSIPTT